jgi:hypothetical protein
MEQKGAASIYQRRRRQMEPGEKLLNLPYPEAVRLGLESRIVEELRQRGTEEIGLYG